MCTKCNDYYIYICACEIFIPLLPNKLFLLHWIQTIAFNLVHLYFTNMNASKHFWCILGAFNSAAVTKLFAKCYNFISAQRIHSAWSITISHRHIVTGPNGELKLCCNKIESLTTNLAFLNERQNVQNQKFVFHVSGCYNPDMTWIKKTETVKSLNRSQSNRDRVVCEFQSFTEIERYRHYL